MSGHLTFTVDLDDPALVAAYDDLPLWSAMAGLLLLEHVPLAPAIVVLDVGCGTGFPAIELAERLGPSSRVHGLDPWAAALDRARAKAAARGVAHVVLDRGDAARMPYADRHFDLIVSNLGLNNLPDPEAAAAECRRVLKPGGRLALSTNLVGHMAELYEVLERVLAETGAEREAGALRRHVDGRASVAGVRALLERHGFRVGRVEETTRLLRYADGTALLNHWFVKLGFLDGWRATVDPARAAEVFGRLEAALPRPLTLTVPFAYIEAQ
ncbi:MAG: SAM-dependent methyltransferase [Alphaproteobacteria bacterium]|nr:SAM-dependent methyltransferase [Alphaproteobacteria bacterium]